jgi:hypothetical protein
MEFLEVLVHILKSSVEFLEVLVHILESSVDIPDTPVGSLNIAVHSLPMV